MKMQLLQYLLLIPLLLGWGRAHTVDQFYTELFPEERGFRAVVYADAAYCLPEYRGDDEKEAPTRDWLIERTEVQHERLRKEAELFIREALGFMQDEVEVKYEVNFPDYNQNPYDFHNPPSQKAILRIELKGDYLPAGGSLQVRWKDAYQANLLVDVVQKTGEGESRNYINIDWLEEGNQMDLGIQIYPFEKEATETVVEVEERNNWFTFVKVGWDHIAGVDEKWMPKGLDHILFVIGLFLFKPNWKPLLHQSFNGDNCICW